MKFGYFFEVQTPEPWTRDNEHAALWTEMQNVQLAEQLGFDSAWICEHHGLGKRAHCSAPEVIIAALTQTTSRIKLGHAIIELVPGVNHIIRIAERLATADHLSKGRIIAGLGRTVVPEDNNTFNVKMTREELYAAWLEGVNALPLIWMENNAEFHGKYFDIPKCNIVPKPYQQPHPPVFTAARSTDTWETAGRLGLGVLAAGFALTPELMRLYDDAARRPLGGFKRRTHEVGAMVHFYCHEDDATGIDRGLVAEDWIQELFYGKPTQPGDRVTRRRLVEEGIHAFGNPQRVIKSLKRYEDMGVSQILLWPRFGMIPEDQVQESMRLFAREVMPHFQGPLGSTTC